MNDEDRILGLFYSDKNTLLYQNIKYAEKISEENKNLLNMLSFKFLGPIFLTDASGIENKWIIELIESSLSHQLGNTINKDMLQSFFSLNSSKFAEDGASHLFALVGSNYTEDVKEIYNILTKFIHPSIIQGAIVNQDLLGENFNFDKFIKEELNRGIRLINYSLGSSRKIYWEEQHQYYCIGLIERIVKSEEKASYLYTFNKNDELRITSLTFIPSFYIMSILSDYYENLILETLRLFNKNTIFPNIQLIHLRNRNKNVIYLEEYKFQRDEKRSYGVILVENNEIMKGGNKISFYRKILRVALDENKELKEILKSLNPRFENLKWATRKEEDLNNLKLNLDKINN
jgi:hypothetical protein